MATLWALSLSGCDQMYGVRRDAQAQAPVTMDRECLIKVALRAPGVQEVSSVSSDSDGFGFAYSASDATGNFRLMGHLHYSASKGKGRLSQTLLTFAGPPPQSMVDATRPAMRYIEEHAIECGLVGITITRDECTRVQCLSDLYNATPLKSALTLTY